MPGCTDTAPPETTTPYELSRIKDAVEALKRVGTPEMNAFWRALPGGTTSRCASDGGARRVGERRRLLVGARSGL
jgi:hypothetical protein